MAKTDADVVAEHRAQGPRTVRVAVLTVSDTRTTATDGSGDRIVALCEAAGHTIARRDLVPDDSEAIRSWVGECRDRSDIEAAILTGGTGVSPRDSTVEAVAPLLDRPIPGFGELFRMLSFAEIGSAAMMSRATAGLAGRMVVFLLPGSRAGVDLAMTRLVVPELPHLVGQARKQ